MKLEDQVCSLELAKKLKELGYPQEGLFWWHPLSPGVNVPFPYVLLPDKEKTEYTECVAPTVAELGEWLPWRIAGDYRLKEYKTEKSWQVCYWYLDMDMKHDEFAENEANARGKMLIWLIENNYIY